VRDIIWTIIVLWIIWKIYDAFKVISKPKTQQQGFNNQQQQYNYRKEGEVKIDTYETKNKPHFKDGDGEYVDYEEIK
jgi:hypothetical protein